MQADDALEIGFNRLCRGVSFRIDIPRTYINWQNLYQSEHCRCDVIDMGREQLDIGKNLEFLNVPVHFPGSLLYLQKNWTIAPN